MERIENIYEVTKRLCGVITPYGDSQIDEVRLQNIKDTISLAEKLIDDIFNVSEYSNSQENSIKNIANEANDFIKILRERFM